jgi:anti-anti-sigma factor
VLDLSAVDFVDSSGLRVLIDAHQRLTDDRRSLVLADPSPAVRRLFDISGVIDYLNVVETSGPSEATS